MEPRKDRRGRGYARQLLRGGHILVFRVTFFDTLRGKWQGYDRRRPGKNQGRFANRFEAASSAPHPPAISLVRVHLFPRARCCVRRWMVQSPCQRWGTQLHSFTTRYQRVTYRRVAREFANVRVFFHRCSFSEQSSDIATEDFTAGFSSSRICAIGALREIMGTCALGVVLRSCNQEP